MSFREKIAAFGPEGALSGVLALPTQQEPGAPGLALFNAGIVHRVGPHRLNVKIARALAARGVASLRFDLSGLGDSRPAESGADLHSRTMADIHAALDELGKTAGAQRFALAGLCSGADNAYRAALLDRRIKGLALIDPYAYESRRAKIERAAAKALDPKRWKSALARVISTDKVRNERATRPEQESSRPHPPAAEFGADLKRLTDRGVDILILYTRFVEGRLTRPEHFFETFAGLDFGGRLTVEVDRAGDHTHTALAAQEALIARLSAFVVGLRR